MPAMASLTDRPVEISAFVRALDQLGHGVLLIEGERITDASDTFCRLVGHDRRALLEMRSVFELVAPAERRRLGEALVRYAAGERPGDRFPVTLELPDGGHIALDAVVKSIDPGAQPPRLLVVVQQMAGQQQVQQQLGYQSRMLESIVETALDGILVVDGAGRMTYYNRRFVELWNIPPEVVASRSDDAALAAVSSQLVEPDEFRARVGYLYAHPTEESHEEIALRDGRAIDRYSAPVVDAEGQPRGRVWFFRDVTAQRRAEAARELLARSGELLGASLDFAATLDQIAHTIVPLFADWAAVDVLDQSGQFRRIGVAHVAPGGEEVLRELDQRWPLVPAAGRLRGRVVQTRKPVALYDVDADELDNLARDPEHKRLLLELGLDSALWVPLTARGRVLGVISAGVRGGRRHYGPADLELLQEVARRSALAVDNALLYRAVDRAGQRQAALAVLGRDALAGMPLSDLFDRAAELLATTMEATFSEILELAPDGRRLKLVAGEGWRKGQVGKATVGVGRGSQAGYTLSTVGPVVVDDMASETRFRPPRLLVEHGAASGLTVVIGSEPPWGVLGAHSDQPNHFAPDDINFVQSVANILASAIARLESEAQLGRVASSERERAAELKAVIESIGDAVVVCDAAGGVALANPAAQQLLGNRLAGGLRSILRAFDWGAEGRAPTLAALKSGVELRMVRGTRRKGAGGAGSGRQPWMELSMYPVVVGDGQTPADGGTLLVMRDITAARDSRQVREAFLGILSHELRTPVTTIYGGAQVLGRETTVAEDVRREIYADLRAEADRLYRLVENLLVLSRVEREGLQVEPEPVLLQRVLPRIVRSEGSRWPETTFETEVPPGLPPVAAEETYLEQVLQNLLGNAAKYGGKEVIVRLGEQAGADGRGEVVVLVLDDGPGVNEADAEHLFEVFFRSPSAARRASGAGIGLFVSQQLVKAMGGRIWARNRPAGGAEFGFAVPVFED
jgi:signal transduction histidine kinase